MFGVIGIAYAQGDGVFLAWLTGADEVPPVETDAIGISIIKVNRTQRAVHYTILVHDIEEVIAAHIHCAPPGVNGPVGVTLFGGETVTPDNLLVSGRFRAPDPGNGCEWTTLSDVLSAISSGNAYVNVHTTANPGGEIRGQVEPLSPGS
jgi:hypothetical protein